MLRKIILSLILILFTAIPAHPQIAVIDVEANPNNWPKQLGHMVAQLLDMAIQATRRELGGRGNTGIYLETQAEDRIGEALTYGSGGSEQWPSTFPFDHVDTTGTWLEAELEREKQVLDTHQTMLRLVERRQQAFEDDEDRIGELTEFTDSSAGRNRLMVSQTKWLMEGVQQERKTQQLLMALIDTITVQHGRDVNQRVNREAMERYVVSNGGKTLALVEWTDRGLW